MSRTGNVFTDALIESGALNEESGFIEWGSVDDYKFPFVAPGPLGMYVITTGWTKMFNEVRRLSSGIDLKWIIEKNAVNTDPVILTWMKSNTSILRVVDDKEVHESYKRARDSEMYYMVPSDYYPGLVMYIEYDVINATFNLRTNFMHARRKFRELVTLKTRLEILNFITDHSDLVEFIPIRINNDFKISHKAYRSGKMEVPEVSVSYAGCDILRNEYAMSRLSVWTDEGNVINPKSRYFILANRNNRHNCYLIKEKAGG